MAKRVTLERILRDNDDARGDSIRSWRIERDDDSSVAFLRKSEGDDFIMLRLADIDQLCEDLRAIFLPTPPSRPR